jgi:hypothetical protein
LIVWLRKVVPADPGHASIGSPTTPPWQQAVVETLEGRIRPLLLGEGCQAHFIEMPAGMFTEEHPHGSESINYMVRGQWGRIHIIDN